MNHPNMKQQHTPNKLPKSSQKPSQSTNTMLHANAQMIQTTHPTTTTTTTTHKSLQSKQITSTTNPKPANHAKTHTLTTSISRSNKLNRSNKKKKQTEDRRRPKADQMPQTPINQSHQCELLKKPKKVQLYGNYPQARKPVKPQKKHRSLEAKETNFGTWRARRAAKIGTLWEMRGEDRDLEREEGSVQRKKWMRMRWRKIFGGGERRRRRF